MTTSPLFFQSPPSQALHLFSCRKKKQREPIWNRYTKSTRSPGIMGVQWKITTILFERKRSDWSISTHFPRKNHGAMGGRVPPNSTSFLIILFQNGWFYQLPNQKRRKNGWFLLCIQLFSRARQPQNMHKIHTVHSGFSDIAMGNLPFEDVSPIKNGGFPLLC